MVDMGNNGKVSGFLLGIQFDHRAAEWRRICLSAIVSMLNLCVASWRTQVARPMKKLQFKQAQLALALCHADAGTLIAEI
jgi:hypothetical protein